MAGSAPNLSDSSEHGDAVISGINVTPFVDVVLVLLVIFMITAPALLKDTLGLQLPKAATSEGAKPKALAIAINEQGQILIEGALSSEDELRTRARAALESDPATQALIAADENSRHAALVLVIDTLKSVGLERFALQVRRKEP
ncbi:MAG: hypothetical protein RJB38_353 [Pseudomonadota bacterium]|jgi:biopolymer transport protein ExbD